MNFQLNHSFILWIYLLQMKMQKYALGREKFERYGRTNTLLTFTHVISVLLGKVSLAKLCGSFSRPPSGMAPITDKDARESSYLQIFKQNQVEINTGCHTILSLYFEILFKRNSNPPRLLSSFLHPWFLHNLATCFCICAN